jgi:hypothetical protein
MHAARLYCENRAVTIRDNGQLVAALLDVAGVASASIEDATGGPGTLRLQLAAGTDQVIVAGEVNRLLRAKFGLAVDPDRVRVIEESAETIPEHLPATNGSPSPFDHDHAHHDHGEWQPTDETPGDVTVRAIGAYARDVAGAAFLETADPVTERIVTSELLLSNGGDPAAGPKVTLARPSRITIDRVQLVSAGLGVAVTVTLGLDGRSIDGEGEGAATQSGVLRSVATATLRAVERIIEGSARFEVEHVEITRAGTDQTALVVLTMVTGRSTQRLSGASVVRDDTRQAVIRAVLAALNRRMEPLLAEQ